MMYVTVLHASSKAGTLCVGGQPIGVRCKPATYGVRIGPASHAPHRHLRHRHPAARQFFFSSFFPFFFFFLAVHCPFHDCYLVVCQVFLSDDRI